MSNMKEEESKCCNDCENKGYGSDPYEFGAYTWYCNNKGCKCHKPLEPQVDKQQETRESEVAKGERIVVFEPKEFKCDHKNTHSYDTNGWYCDYCGSHNTGFIAGTPGASGYSKPTKRCKHKTED